MVISGDQNLVFQRNFINYSMTSRKKEGRIIIIYYQSQIDRASRIRNKIRFFSESVVASLEYFQGEVAQIVIAVCFSFDDFDLVVNPFQFAGVDGIITMV